MHVKVNIKWSLGKRVEVVFVTHFLTQEHFNYDQVIYLIRYVLNHELVQKAILPRKIVKYQGHWDMIK